MQVEHPASRASVDRRNGLRQMSVPVEIDVESADCARHRATLVDVSRSGVRLRCEAQLGLGTEVWLVGPPDTGLAPVRARIVRRTEPTDAPPREFDYGAAFADPLSEDRHAWFLTLRRAA